MHVCKTAYMEYKVAKLKQRFGFPVKLWFSISAGPFPYKLPT